MLRLQLLRIGSCKKEILKQIHEVKVMICLFYKVIRYLTINDIPRQTERSSLWGQLTNLEKIANIPSPINVNIKRIDVKKYNIKR